jgi:DNA polymerase III epsilon subunit-like protein
MILPKWESLLKQWYGQGLPDDYLTFDTETTGFRRTTDHEKGYGADLPIDVGWRLVRGREIVYQGHYYLDWTRYPEYVEPEWLEDELARVGRQLQKAGKTWRYSPELLAKQGRDPFWVLNLTYDLFEANRESGSTFVGHNALAFDASLLNTTFQEFLGKPWEFLDGELLDTGSLEKVLGCLATNDSYQFFTPRGDEPLGAFLRRVAASPRSGVPWNIEHCVEKYQYVKRHGLDPTKLHGADADSHVCHLLIEDNRE